MRLDQVPDRMGRFLLMETIISVVDLWFHQLLYKQVVLPMISVH